MLPPPRMVSAKPSGTETLRVTPPLQPLPILNAALLIMVPIPERSSTRFSLMVRGSMRRQYQLPDGVLHTERTSFRDHTHTRLPERDGSTSRQHP